MTLPWASVLTPELEWPGPGFAAQRAGVGATSASPDRDATGLHRDHPPLGAMAELSARSSAPPGRYAASPVAASSRPHQCGSLVGGIT